MHVGSYGPVQMSRHGFDDPKPQARQDMALGGARLGHTAQAVLNSAKELAKRRLLWLCLGEAPARIPRFSSLGPTQDCHFL